MLFICSIHGTLSAHMPLRSVTTCVQCCKVLSIPLSKDATRRLDPANVAAGWARMECTAYQWAASAGAKWFHTSMMSDVDLLRPASLLDMSFMASALLVAQARNARMVMEVVLPTEETGSLVQWHRVAGAVAVGQQGGGGCALAAHVPDFSSSIVRGSRLLCGGGVECVWSGQLHLKEQITSLQHHFVTVLTRSVQVSIASLVLRLDQAIVRVL